METNFLRLRILTLLALSQAGSAQFLNRPDDQSYCVDDTIYLDWRLEPETIAEEPGVFWHFVEYKDDKIAMWTATGGMTKARKYQSRADWNRSDFAALKIRNATKADAGSYRFDELDRKFFDVVNVAVYDESDLIPNLQINGKHVNLADTRNQFEVEGSTINVAIMTAHGLEANVSAYSNGKKILQCAQVKLCAGTFTPSEATESITIKMDNGVCRVQEYEITVTATGGGVPKYLVLVLVMLVLIVGLTVPYCLVWRFYHKKERNREDLSSLEKAFVRRSCCLPVNGRLPDEPDNTATDRLIRRESRQNNSDTIRIAVCGKNGVGKATFINVLCGEEVCKPDQLDEVTDRPDPYPHPRSDGKFIFQKVPDLAEYKEDPKIPIECFCDVLEFKLNDLVLVLNNDTRLLNDDLEYCKIAKSSQPRQKFAVINSKVKERAKTTDNKMKRLDKYDLKSHLLGKGHFSFNAKSNPEQDKEFLSLIDAIESHFDFSDEKRNIVQEAFRNIR